MRTKKALLHFATILLIATVLATPATSTHALLTIRGLQNPNGQISVFVEDSHTFTSGEIQLLNNYGTVTTVAGRIAVLHTLVTELPEMQNLPFLVRIENSHTLSVDSYDRNVADIGAPEVWNQIKDEYGRNVTGAGVVVGFVDTGIDTTHPDFTFPNGTTKILYVWDQTTQGNPPPGFNYGFECSSLDIQGRRCPENDTFGHGTHVAGIAASSGMATGNYTGVAPGASVIFVKSGYSVCNGESWTFYTTQILDGVNYIVNKAKQLGMRAVISLSLGGNIGAHDGTDPLELGLDAIVNSGTPVVVAAGNQAQDNAHIQGQLSQGSNVTFQLEAQGSTVDIQIDVWFSPQDQIDATLRTPDGQTYSVPTRPGGVSSANYGNITTTTSSSDTGKELYLEVNSTHELPTQGWSVTLTAKRINGQGIWDAWTDAVTCSFPGTYFLPGDGFSIKNQDTIGIPGTAKDVVTVGAYITTTSWIGMDDQPYGRRNAPVGGIASFSSLGPTRDGRIKPDVAAPGALIVSARSSAVTSHSSDPDPAHRVLAGTSMATPHVAGTVALMLQYKPQIQALQVPRLLRDAARLDPNTGVVTNGSPVWGFGKVDARTATGFFRLTLLLSGVPDSLIIPAQIDTEKKLEIASGSLTSIYFLNGTSHVVSFDAETQGAPSTRYELQNSRFEVSSTALKTLNYSVQYFLTIDSRYTPTSGEGWYDANATARPSAPTHVPAPGLLGYFGLEYSLAHWVTGDGKTVSDSVIMDTPKTVKAVYALTFPLEVFVAILVVLAAIVVGVVAIARKRMT